MHPHRRAARDPLRDRLVREDLTLPAGDGSEQRDPVADLLTPVAAVALDLGVGETDERLDIEPLISLTHAEIERDGGNGGQEIRNWIALLGAVPGWKGEVLAYEPVAEWITGCATVWVHP